MPLVDGAVVGVWVAEADRGAQALIHLAKSGDARVQDLPASVACASFDGEQIDWTVVNAGVGQWEIDEVDGTKVRVAFRDRESDQLCTVFLASLARDKDLQLFAVAGDPDSGDRLTFSRSPDADLP